jgi:acyl-CoA dehydrogenase
VTIYTAPVADTMFVLRHVLRIHERKDVPGFDEDLLDVSTSALAMVGEFCADVLQPLNAVADLDGCAQAADGTVATPPGFVDAYRRFAQGGWGGLAIPADQGGGGMPLVLAQACHEYVWSANPSFAMYASNLGHVRILMKHGTEEQQRAYIPQLAAGEWTGAMGLTEPAAGSDLSLVRTVATPRDDGTYAVNGGKLFTSGGEHDLTDNIIHFVLARLPGAPEGTRGLSMFLVPKMLLDDQGRPAVRNGVVATRVEHKMGLRGSATCQMNYDDATGFLVGEPHRGLAAMFVLMNELRITASTVGVGVAEVAYQNAAAYAKERLQGRSPIAGRNGDGAADPIIEQPDVRRLLLTVGSFAEGARALLLWTSMQSDIAARSDDPDERHAAGRRLALFTPVVKGTLPDFSFESAVYAQLIFGGHGYMTETGVDQFMRDVRMAAFGEGVTAIQADDLVRRKIGIDSGRVVEQALADIEDDVQAAESTGQVDSASLMAMRTGLGHLREATEWISAADPAAAAAGGVHYLHLFGRVALGWMWVREAAAVACLSTAGEQSPALERKDVLARFYLSRLPIETARHLDLMRSESESVLSLPAAAF